MSKHVKYKKRAVHGGIGAKFKNLGRRIKEFWRSRKKWQKVTIVSVTSFVLVAAIAAGIIGGYFGHVMSKIERDDDFNKLDFNELGFEDVIDKNVYNIALFGIDTQKYKDKSGAAVFDGNSDSIMILSLNKNEGTIKLVSVMRDSLVPIDNGGKTVTTKINAAYAYGGPALAVKTLNTLFGLDISEYATVNFFGMIDIIDAVGGIEAEITQDELTCSININTHIRNQCDSLGIDPTPYLMKNSGKQQLNGIQAVAYARIRYGKNWLGSSNDFGRTERQRYVMQQLLEKALAMDISSYPGLASKLAPYVKTSFSNSELLNLASFLSKRPQMITSRVPSDKYIINSDFRGTGSSTIYYNYKYAAKVLHAFLYDGISDEDYMAQNGVDKTAWFGADKTATDKNTDKNSSGNTNNAAASSAQENTSSDTASSEPTDSKPSSSSSVSSTEPDTPSQPLQPSQPSQPETSNPTAPTQPTEESEK